MTESWPRSPGLKASSSEVPGAPRRRCSFPAVRRRHGHVRLATAVDRRSPAPEQRHSRRFRRADDGHRRGGDDTVRGPARASLTDLRKTRRVAAHERQGGATLRIGLRQSGADAQFFCTGTHRAPFRAHCLSGCGPAQRGEVACHLCACKHLHYNKFRVEKRLHL